MESGRGGCGEWELYLRVKGRLGSLRALIEGGYFGGYKWKKPIPCPCFTDHMAPGQGPWQHIFERIVVDFDIFNVLFFWLKKLLKHVFVLKIALHKCNSRTIFNIYIEKEYHICYIYWMSYGLL